MDDLDLERIKFFKTKESASKKLPITLRSKFLFGFHILKKRLKNSKWHKKSVHHIRCDGHFFNQF
jgi:hypothetical protein